MIKSIMLKNHIIISPISLPWDWSADYQRQTLIRLARQNKVIIYDQHKAHFFLKKPAPNKALQAKLPKNVTLYTPRYFLPLRSLPVIERLNQQWSYWLLLFQLRHEEKIIWVFDPFFAFMTQKPPGNLGGTATTLYDCVDYHVGQPGAQEDTIHQENTLIRQSDFFFVNSNVLYDQHSRLRATFGKKTHLAPQGFDQESFEAESFEKKDTKRARKFANPLIGYVGGINDRLDFQLIEQLVRTNPQWKFDFWGPIQSAEAEKKIKTLQKFHNFYYGGAVSRQQLTQIMAQFDVGIIPYTTQSDFNRLSYPMKVLEYFYLGKPVVSSPIQELGQFPEWVALADSAKAWQTHLTRLLKRPWPASHQRAQKKFANKNSWEEKIAAITKIIG